MTAVDLIGSKLELARKFGATDVVNPLNQDAVEAVRAIAGGLGADHAFEAIGMLATLEQPVSMVDVGGTANMVGMQKLASIFHRLPAGR